MTRFLFVGERQSPKAAAIGATWQNGRLAARSLHDALRVHNIAPEDCEFVNLWREPGIGRTTIAPRVSVLRLVRRRAREGTTVVALGSLVARELTVRSIPHRRVVHPAARGSIRKKERYAEHIGAALAPVPRPPTDHD